MTIGKKLEGIQDDTKHKLIRKAVYLVSHLCFGAVTMFFAALMYYNHAAHFLFAVCILSASAWNGAGFYGELASFQPAFVFCRERDISVENEGEQLDESIIWLIFPGNFRRREGVGD